MIDLQNTPQDRSVLMPHMRILSMKEVCAMTGFSRTHIYRLEAKGKFPRRRKLGLAKIGFMYLEVQAWIEQLEKPDLLSQDDV